MRKADGAAQQFDTFADMVAATAEILKPPERLTVSQAAEKYRHLNNPGSYIGPWRNHVTPYLVEPMDTLGSRSYTATVFVGPAQSGKTDMILNWHGYGVVCDPADFLLYQTSQSVARDFSRRRVDRLHRYSPEIGRRLMRKGDSDNTYDKFYTSGTMLTLSWPTINELSGRPVGRVALTDYDRMPQDVDGEGAPFDLARKRTTTFGSFAMTLAESSPGFSTANSNWMRQTPHEAPPAPGVASLFNRGDRRLWYWPCPHCREYYEPSFRLLHWPHSDDLVECAEAAQMMCPHCSALMAPTLKAQVNREGRWVPDGMKIDRTGELTGRPGRSDIASFWLKGPAATFADWKTLVLNYLKAEQEFERTGSQDALRSTVNTDQGEIYFERGMGTERLPEDLRDRAEDFGDDPVVPEGVRFLVATIDVQANRWEVQVHGVTAPPGEDAECDTIVIERFAIVKSERYDPDGERYWVKPGTYLEDWDLLTEQVMQRTYPLADGSGRRMAIKITGCDSGGKKGVTSMAYQYWRKLRQAGQGARFLLLKGEGSPRAPRINLTYPDSARKDRTAGARGEIPVLLIQTDKLKDQLDHVLERTEPGGMIRFSENLPDEFYSELTVEQKDSKGRWINPRKLRQEAWDLLVYHLALCSYLRIESFRWHDPPGWAAPWDENTLVSEPEAPRAFEARKKADYSLGKLAETLG